eukprot:Rhum_TRINITY_DN508_c0_g1::Rhum_TRINITY_DN508_c0_g1_i1::g.1601::m.1601
MKETEKKLKDEVEKWKKDAKAKEKQLDDMRTTHATERRSWKEKDQSRKSLTMGASKEDQAKAAEKDALVKDLQVKLSEALKKGLERDAEVHALQTQLKRAHEAIEAGAQVGYNNEVKLHQARSALHAIMSEVSAAASPVQGRSRTPSDCGAAASPERIDAHPHNPPSRCSVGRPSSSSPAQLPPYTQQAQSPQRFSFNYSSRMDGSPIPAPTNSPHHRQ